VYPLKIIFFCRERKTKSPAGLFFRFFLLLLLIRVGFPFPSKKEKIEILSEIFGFFQLA